MTRRSKNDAALGGQVKNLYAERSESFLPSGFD